MGWLFPTAAFNGFGPSAFHGWGTSRATFVSAGNTKTLLKKLAEICPRGQSGVYALVNGRGELYYLGKAKCLRTRLLGYFNPSSRKAKSGRLARVARTIWWEPVPDEFGALLRELELIRKMAPTCNVKGIPEDRTRFYLELTGGAAPYLRAVRQIKAGATRHWGPLPWTRRMREAIRAVNLHFRLRECPRPHPPLFPGGGALLMLGQAGGPSGCMRHGLGLCIAPCLAGASRQEYGNAVGACLAFLGGDSVATVGLERAMHAAASETDFERAATLRDRMQRMAYLQAHLGRLEAAWSLHGVHAVLGPSGVETWYLLHRGRIIEALARPRKSTQALGRLRKLLGARDGLPEGWRVWQLDQIDQVLLVMSWLKNNPQTVGRRLWTCDQADQWIPGDWEISKGSKQAENRGPVTDCA